MSILSKKGARIASFILITAIVASCGLPRTGPGKREIFAGSVQKQGDAFVVTVNSRVTRATAVQPVLGFSDGFLNAGVLGSDVINPGDTLSLLIYENVDDGLLAGEGGNATPLDEVQVDGNGFIFVPYAGRIKAAGNTPEALRRVITNKLNTQTPDPQVIVRRVAGDGSTVSLVGGVGAQGIYAIERPTRTLSTMIARAGGIAIPPEVAQISVIRGGHTSRVWFEDLFADPKFDIALRGGDRILVEQDTRAFTVLGATGAQSRLEFTTQTLSAIEAIAQVGGLNSNLADPTGVFVFRNEPDEIANTVLNRTDLQGDQRMVYVLDLTEPTGMFEARDFVIRDGDTMYVTEAPFVTWNKTISALTGSLASANALATAAEGGN
ncbi:MAG: polysaccharide biosynthesis/export family protein [Pseudomonadota bacterium]